MFIYAVAIKSNVKFRLMKETSSSDPAPGAIPRMHLIGLFGGPLIFLFLLLLPVPENLSPEGWTTAAVLALMAIWWITEAIPIPMTALIPLVLLPTLGVRTMAETASPYADPLIFLFLGGFIIATAMQVWNLHRRIALRIVARVGTSPSTIVLGFMCASAFLSMWVSNTATALMMLPIGMSVMALAHDRAVFEERAALKTFGTALMLGIGYSCSIGGLGTLIGSPPNALMAGFLQSSYGIEVSFVKWMMMGVPVVVLTLPVVWLILTKRLFPIELEELPGGRSVIDEELSSLGVMSAEEKKVMFVFALTALLWVTRPMLSSLLPGLNDSVIAIAASVVLFLTPANLREGKFLLSWDDIQGIPWGILILFGGGLSLAGAITSSGLADWIGSGVTRFSVLPLILMIFAVVATVNMMTEITSNTATAATFLPILASVAVGLGYSPLYFVVPGTMIASCTFMMPVATPPNAIVYSTGLFTIQQMVRAGIWLNIFYNFVFTLFGYFVLDLLFRGMI